MLDLDNVSLVDVKAYAEQFQKESARLARPIRRLHLAFHHMIGQHGYLHECEFTFGYLRQVGEFVNWLYHEGYLHSDHMNERFWKSEFNHDPDADVPMVGDVSNENGQDQTIVDSPFNSKCIHSLQLLNLSDCFLLHDLASDLQATIHRYRHLIADKHQAFNDGLLDQLPSPGGIYEH